MLFLSQTVEGADSTGNFDLVSLFSMPANLDDINAGSVCTTYAGNVPIETSVTVECRVTTSFLAFRQEASFLLCEV